MNNLGGMVFIVAGIALGYWVITGKAVNFLHALNTGQGLPQQMIPQQQGSGSGTPVQMVSTLPQEASNAASAVFNDNYSPGSNTTQQNAIPWNLIA